MSVIQSSVKSNLFFIGVAPVWCVIHRTYAIFYETLLITSLVRLGNLASKEGCVSPDSYKIGLSSSVAVSCLNCGLYQINVERACQNTCLVFYMIRRRASATVQTLDPTNTRYHHLKLASIFPSGLNTTLCSPTLPRCPSSILKCLPVRTSHNITARSLDPFVSIFPSGLKAML